MLNKHVADDGFHSESVKFAEFDTMFEIPVIEPNKKIVIPDSLVSYSKIKYADKKKTAICFYEHDRVFKNAADDPESVCGQISGFQTVLTPDCSLYWDMPLCLQRSTFIGTEEPDAAGSRKECMSFRISGGETKEHMRLAF